MLNKLKEKFRSSKATNVDENENLTDDSVENSSTSLPNKTPKQETITPTAKETIRDDEDYKIEKTSQGKNRVYQITNKKDEINYELDIRQTEGSIYINAAVSKGNAVKRYYRGAHADSSSENPYGLECNFLSTLKMKKNTSGELIRVLLKLTKDELLEAPSKVSEIKKTKKLEKQKRMEEIQKKEDEKRKTELEKENKLYMDLYGMDKTTYDLSRVKNEQKIEESVTSLILKTKTHER